MQVFLNIFLSFIHIHKEARQLPNGFIKFEQLKKHEFLFIPVLSKISCLIIDRYRENYILSPFCLDSEQPSD